MIQTRLSRFALEFDVVLRPVLEPVAELAAALEEAGASEGPDEEGGLGALRHELGVLADKVAEQKAYLLIFGPLKSGKSTLMNALAGAWVSEVTSLPAYPCMVHLTPSSRRSFSALRYDGEREELGDPAALRLYVRRAHAELAARLRERENRGLDFDPERDLPHAIRRIDVEAPAGELERSAAVLVDTPGLYSRMKFGYDRMTREFRNTAACAIFVVKTDNLFLEQVFQEFGELLELFSRIFLLVNVDTGKHDLAPDGTLVPSLERSDPLRLVEAFESLAMSAPLKQAAEEGRLRLYPVDLLRAASWRIQRGRGAAPSPQEGSEAYPGQESFETFLHDLTEYVSSSDFVDAFVTDSLRRARNLLAQAGESSARPLVRGLLDELAALEELRSDKRRVREALRRLREHDWRGSSGGLRARLSGPLAQRAEALGARTRGELERAVDAWFQEDSSLSELHDGRLVPGFVEHWEALAGHAHDALARAALEEDGGLALPEELRADLERAGLGLAELAREAVRAVDREREAPPVETLFTTADLPVRKRIWDWLLFRGRAKVRLKLFGPPQRPTRRVRRAEKSARLGDAGREALQDLLAARLDAWLDESAALAPERVLRAFEERFVPRLEKELGRRLGALEQELASLDARITRQRRVRAAVRDVEDAVRDARSGIEPLGARFGADSDWLQPAPPPAEARPAALAAEAPAPEPVGEEVEPPAEAELVEPAPEHEPESRG